MYHVACFVATALASNSSGFKVVRISPIPDQVTRLQVISCDVCSAGRASFDVFVDGVISEVTALKRCCDKCVGSFSR